MAVIEAPVVLKYRPLLEHLSEREDSFVADLPKPLAEPSLLNAAWSTGVIEFGRRNHCETGEPSEDSKMHKKRVILETGIAWGGLKKVYHKTIRDLLAEESAQPKACVELREVRSHDTHKLVQSYETADASELRLRVRLTDKGLAVLAG